MDSLTVNTFVKNIHQTIAFYQLLGFELSMQVPEEGNELIWAMLINGSVTIMVQSVESLGEELPGINRNQPGGSLLFYIKLKQIREYFEKIKDKVEIIKGIEKTFYGATEFTIRDIDGYYLTFAEDEPQ